MEEHGISTRVKIILVLNLMIMIKLDVGHANRFVLAPLDSEHEFNTDNTAKMCAQMCERICTLQLNRHRDYSHAELELEADVGFMKCTFQCMIKCRNKFV